MSDGPAASTSIEGHVVHKKSNALQITFRDGTGDPFAVGGQGAGAGEGKKLGVLFGFKNSSTGNHVLTYDDGSALGIASREGEPTVFTRVPDGAGVASVQRGAGSTAVLAGGGALFQFSADPDEAVPLGCSA